MDGWMGTQIIEDLLWGTGLHTYGGWVIPWSAQESQWCSSRLKPQLLRASGVNPGASKKFWEPEELMSKGREWMSQLQWREQICFLSLFSFYLALNSLWKDILFNQTISSNANLVPQTTSWTHPEIAFYQLPGYSLAHPSWHIKLIIT